jgi:hypothetical protein
MGQTLWLLRLPMRSLLLRSGQITGMRLPDGGLIRYHLHVF